MNGGDEGARTPDLGIANAALSQLSYIPTNFEFPLYNNDIIRSNQNNLEYFILILYERLFPSLTEHTEAQGLFDLNS